MTTPDFVLRLRAAIGHDPLWLIGASAIVLRPGDTGQQVLLGKRSDSGRWSSIDGIVEPGEAPRRPRCANASRRPSSPWRWSGW
uniref:Nudix hydrolase domain-containing protein n=1 Tax=Propionibacterium freudenreichii TaxID=1744 RepID=A0A2C7AT55_9ACTN